MKVHALKILKKHIPAQGRKRPAKGSRFRKGSISVYLCLVFGVMLILIFVCIDSARYISGRSAVSCAVDEGMFSLFSKYDRTLYKKYGLIFLDAGFGTQSINMGALMDDVEENMVKVLEPFSPGTVPGKLYRIETEKTSVTGYVLASDSGYAPLKDQICELMKLKIGADAAGILAGKVKSVSENINAFSMEDDKDMEGLLEDYKAKKAESAAENAALEAGITDVQAEETGQATGTVTIPEDFENPVETVAEMKEKEAYELAAPDAAGISNAAIDKNALASGRELRTGMGLMPMKTRGLDEKLFLGEYAIDFFPDYLDKEESKDVLKYQTEYIIAGKDKDWSNLKAVTNRILLIREGFNYLYLITDPSRMAEVHEAALIISTVVLSPEMEETVSQLITLCWAYAESIADLKVLLSGGKEPLFKDDATWQVSLFGISRLETKNDSGGLSYRDYLRVLLYATAEDKVTARIADMLEHNKRITDKQPAFSIDSCIASMEAQFEGTVSGHSFAVKGSYSYTSE